ncbi:hypothetical protein [Streptomyces klenkii]|nr:hypothetical protein [Streptomyces klenkii]
MPTQVIIRTVPAGAPPAEDGLYFSVAHLPEPEIPRHMPHARSEEEVSCPECAAARKVVMDDDGAIALAVRIAESAKEQMFGFANRRQAAVHVTVAGPAMTAHIIARDVATYLYGDDIPHTHQADPRLAGG